MKIDISAMLDSGVMPTREDIEKSLGKKNFKQLADVDFKTAAKKLEKASGEDVNFGYARGYPVLLTYGLAALDGEKDAYGAMIRVAKMLLHGADVHDPRVAQILEICQAKKKNLQGSLPAKKTADTLDQAIVGQDLTNLFDNLNSFEDRILAERLDIAFEIYEHCLTSLGKNLTKEMLKEIMAAKKMATDFLLITLNINAEADIEPLMAARSRIKLYRPQYIPRKHAKNLAKGIPAASTTASPAKQNWHKLVELSRAHKPTKYLHMRENKFQTDIDEQTILLTPLERDVHRVIVKDGILQQRMHDNSFEKFDSINRRSHGKDEYVAYTINPEREISVFDHFEIADGYAHSSMNAQGRIIVSGEMRVENGELTHLTVHSMHYRPQEENVYEALKIFKDEGVDLTKVTVCLWDEKNGLHSKKFIEVNAQEFFDFHAAVERENENIQVLLHPSEGYREYIHPTKGSSYEIIPQNEIKVSASGATLFAVPHQVFDMPKRSILEERADLQAIVKNLRSK